MICVHPHAWFTRCWALNTELVHAGQVLSQLSCSSSRCCVWVGIQWFLLLFSLALLFNAAVSLSAWLQLCPKDLCLLDFYFPSVSYCLMCPLRLLCLMDYQKCVVSLGFFTFTPVIDFQFDYSAAGGYTLHNFTFLCLVCLYFSSLVIKFRARDS